MSQWSQSKNGQSTGAASTAASSKAAYNVVTTQPKSNSCFGSQSSNSFSESKSLLATNNQSSSGNSKPILSSSKNRASPSSSRHLFKMGSCCKSTGWCSDDSDYL